MISGKTRLVGVIGWPVGHSLSPAMHNAAFAALGLDFAYVPLPVAPGSLPAALQGLRAMGFAGANVTVPHKAEAFECIRRLTPIAGAVGAVNTIVVEEDGELLGDNTDGDGFLEDLRAHDIDPRGRSVLLIGAGGAARAVVYALANAGASVAVLNRTVARAAELCERTAAALPGARVSAHAFPSDLARLAGDANLIVNATSLGLHADADPMPWDDALPFRPDQVVYDLVYSTPTSLLAFARRSGARAIDGLGMLIHQGAAAFFRWTGQAAPIDVMENALRTQIESRTTAEGRRR